MTAPRIDKVQLGLLSVGIISILGTVLAAWDGVHTDIEVLKVKVTGLEKKMDNPPFCKPAVALGANGETGVAK